MQILITIRTLSFHFTHSQFKRKWESLKSWKVAWDTHAKYLCRWKTNYISDFVFRLFFYASCWKMCCFSGCIIETIWSSVLFIFLNLVIKVGTTMWMTILVILILIVVIYIGYYIWDFVRSRYRPVEEENEDSKSKEESKKEKINKINFPLNNLELLK